MSLWKQKQNIKNFFGGKIRHARVQTVCSRRSTARRRASEGYSGFAEKNCTTTVQRSIRGGEVQTTAADQATKRTRKDL